MTNPYTLSQERYDALLEAERRLHEMLPSITSRHMWQCFACSEWNYMQGTTCGKCQAARDPLGGRLVCGDCGHGYVERMDEHYWDFGRMPFDHPFRCRLQDGVEFGACFMLRGHRGKCHDHPDWADLKLDGSPATAEGMAAEAHAAGRNCGFSTCLPCSQRRDRQECAHTPERKGRKSASPCGTCGAFDVYVTQDSDYDADFDIHCYNCGKHYRVDGPDA